MDDRPRGRGAVRAGGRRRAGHAHRSRCPGPRSWPGTAALVGGFEPAPPGHPLAAGLPAGSVTDDTEQAVLLARLLDRRAAAGSTPAALARRPAGLGGVDAGAGLAGPARPVHQAGPGRAAGRARTSAWRAGTGPPTARPCGSPRSASPPPAADPRLLVDRVVEASRVTHNTGVALAGAAAVAAAVSAGIDGATLPEAIGRAVAAAASAAGRGHWVAGADVAARITWAAGLVAGLAPARRSSAPCTRWSGTSLATQESVPAAFAVLAASPGRSLAGLPPGRVPGRRLRHDRRDGRRDRRRVPRGGGASRAARRGDQVNDVQRPGRRDLLALGRACSPSRRPPPGTVTDVPVRPGCCTSATWSSTWCWTCPRSRNAAATCWPPRPQVTAGGGFNVMAAAAARGLPVGYGGRVRHRAVRRRWPGPRWRTQGSRCCSRPKPGRGHRVRGQPGRGRRRADVPDQPRARRPR